MNEKFLDYKLWVGKQIVIGDRIPDRKVCWPSKKNFWYLNL